MRICNACEMVLISCSVLSAPCPMAQADLITFKRVGDFNDSNIDGQGSGSITRMGLTATFTANIGELNATGSSFGINAPGSDDKSALLDTVNEGTVNEVIETITVTFDQPVAFTQLTLDDFSPGETALLKIGPNEVMLDPLPAGTDVYNFNGGSNLVALGQSLVIGSGSGNGFSLEGFQVNTVPEPSCLSIAFPALAGFSLRRKRRSQVV